LHPYFAWVRIPGTNHIAFVIRAMERIGKMACAIAGKRRDYRRPDETGRIQAEGSCFSKS
jgi:hypothetical protein